MYVDIVILEELYNYRCFDRAFECCRVWGGVMRRKGGKGKRKMRDGCLAKRMRELHTVLAEHNVNVDVDVHRSSRYGMMFN
jgi:hypothetical protein